MRRRRPALLATALLLSSLSAAPQAVSAAPNAPSRGTPAAQQVAPSVQKITLSGVSRSALPEAPQAAAPEHSEHADERLAASAPTPDTVPEVLTERTRTRKFGLVGFTWDQATTPAGAALQVRVREARGWTEWTTLSTSEDGPDPASAEGQRTATAATEPLFVDSADGVQVRVDTPDGSKPAQLQAVLVDPGESAADSALPASAAASATPSNAASVAPYVISRGQWGADESLRACNPDTNSTVQMAIVHHTDSVNNYSADDVPGMIRGIYAFHVQGRGWCDIGYNFLIDKFGRIFEGRFGGTDRGVVGAHAAGFNSVSTGVSMIGNFSLGGWSPQMIGAAQQVIGWKMAVHGGNPQGLVTVTSGGGPRYPAGTVVTLNVVSGHRDVGQTDCPGNNTMNLLPTIRSGAAYYVNLARGPVGHVDSIAPVPGGLSIAGWAIDVDTADPIYVWVNVSGVGNPAYANRSRPDVGAVYPGYGSNHGFSEWISKPPGTYSVCIHGVNVGPGASTLLGCSTVTVGGTPFGMLEGVHGVSGGINVSGWTIDPDTASPIFAWIDISGSAIAPSAGGARPDVAAAFPGYGPNHGYHVTVSRPPGFYTVCVWGVNVGAGQHGFLGCRQVQVT